MFIGLSAFNITGFNRTFMELKWKRCSSRMASLWFQSYLYGIEMPVVMSLARNIRRFNRTFMELKFVMTSALRAVVRFSFQSYLYGIEMHVLNFQPFQHLSFNRTFMELK